MEALPFPDPPLTDGEILLRAKTPDDSPALVAALADPDIPRYTNVPSPYTMDDALDWFTRSEEMREAGEHLNLLVVEASQPEVVLGSVGLMREAHREQVGEIGYWVAKEARGRGIAARATVLLRDWAAQAIPIKTFELVIDEVNEYSRVVAEAAGFVWHGERRVQPRTEGATELTHRAYIWEPTSAE